MVRGLGYYSKTTLEIISDHLGAQNAICGGGRYDNLIQSMGGPEKPAVGFAFGLERTVSVLKQFSDIIKKAPLMYIAPLGSSQQAFCLNLADQLRQEGIKCEIDFNDINLKALLKKANKKQCFSYNYLR